MLKIFYLMPDIQVSFRSLCRAILRERIWGPDKYMLCLLQGDEKIMMSSHLKSPQVACSDTVFLLRTKYSSYVCGHCALPLIGCHCLFPEEQTFQAIWGTSTGPWHHHPTVLISSPLPELTGRSITTWIICSLKSSYLEAIWHYDI